MKIVLLDAATLGKDMDFSLFSDLGEFVSYNSTAPDEVEARLLDADVAILNKVRLGEHELQKAPRLKLIAITATGYDNVDVDACRAHHIGVANVAGYSTHSVVQVTVATALSLYTRLAQYANHVAGGAYSQGNCFNCLEPTYREICGKTWGIVGLGNIGTKVAKVAEAMGCRVIAYTRTPKGGYSCCSLESLCKEADIITLHTPLNADTRGLIDHRMLQLMKPGAVLVNEARGAVVDEEAVAAAVLSGKLYYGADVYSAEPFGKEHPIYSIISHPNTCFTPHMAWGAFEARERCLREVFLNIEAYQKGMTRNRIV